MKEKLVEWIEHVYQNNGFWPAVVVVLLIVVFWAAGLYLDLPLSAWLMQ